jgi:hypothetical protein
MCRHLCRRRHCDCCPHDDGVIAVVNAQASLPLSRWCRLPRNNGIIAIDPQRCCCPRRDCIVAVLKLESLPSSLWCPRHHRCHRPRGLLASWHRRRRCAGIFAVVAMAIVALITMASSPLLMHRRVSAVVELALSPSPLVIKLVASPTFRWRCCHRCAGFLPLSRLQFLP